MIESQIDDATPVTHREEAQQHKCITVARHGP